jgi:tryptophan 2,3-dioxygenase
MAGYAEYIKLEQLLTLQQPRTKRLATELTFIVAHQVYELWFKLIVAALEQAIAAIDCNDPGSALSDLRRVNEIERLMLDQLVLLERLDPCEFAEIRRSLGSSSAAESEQFSHIEALSSHALLTRYPVQPTRDLWSAFCGFAQREGLVMPNGTDEVSCTLRAESLHRIYACRGAVSKLRSHHALIELCEALLDHDENFALWRYRHSLTVFRQIGLAAGTGGTSGVRYLERRTNRRFYPEMWEARSVFSREHVGVDS